MSHRRIIIITSAAGSPELTEDEQAFLLGVVAALVAHQCIDKETMVRAIQLVNKVLAE